MIVNSQFCNSDSPLRNKGDGFRREVAQAYLSSDKPSNAIGHRFGVSEDSVRKWARQFYPEEYAARIQRGKDNPPRKKTPELMERAVALAQAGTSINQISRQVRVSPQTVTEWLREGGYGNLIRPPKRRFIPVDLKRKAVDEYLAGTPSYRVATKYNVSDTSVERWALQALEGAL